MGDASKVGKRETIDTDLFAAVVDSDVKKVIELLQQGTDAEELSLSGITPLHEAVRSDKIDIAAALLLFSANPTQSTASGARVSDLAANPAMTTLLGFFSCEAEIDTNSTKLVLGAIDKFMRWRMAKHMDTLKEKHKQHKLANKVGSKTSRLGKLRQLNQQKTMGQLLGPAAAALHTKEAPSLDAPAVAASAPSTSAGRESPSNKSAELAKAAREQQPPSRDAPSATRAQEEASDSTWATASRTRAQEQPSDSTSNLAAGEPANTVDQENSSRAPRRSRWQHLASLSSGSSDFASTSPELPKPIGFDRYGRPVHVLPTAQPKQPSSYVSETAQSSGNKSLVAQLQEKERRLQEQFAAFNVQMPSRWKDPERFAPANKSGKQQRAPSPPESLPYKPPERTATEKDQHDMHQGSVADDVGSASSASKSEPPAVVSQLSVPLAPEDLIGDPLIVAVRRGAVDEVQQLLKSGSSPDVCDEIGETPLFEAISAGSFDLVVALMLARADPEHRSASGLKPTDFASGDDMGSLLRVFMDLDSYSEESREFAHRIRDEEVREGFERMLNARHAEFATMRLTRAFTGQH